MPENFKSFFAASEGWGSYSQNITGGGLSARLEVKWGKLRLKEISLCPPTAVVTGTTVISDRKQLPHRLALQDGKAVIILTDEKVVLAGSALEIKMQP